MAAGSVVIVGGGPCGSLAAIVLGSRGFQVDVFERLPREFEVDPQARYTIRMTSRAVKAIEAAGLSVPPSVAGKSVQGVRYTGTEAVSFPQTMDGSESVFMTQRSLLWKFLLEHAENHPSKNVRVHYSCTFDRLLEDGRVAQFQRLKAPGKADAGKPDPMGENGASDAFHSGDDTGVRKTFDLLLAADGVNSGVRQELQRLDPDLKVRQVRDKSATKRFPHLPPSAADHPLLSGRPPYTFFSFKPVNKTRGDVRLGASLCQLPPDGEYGGGLWVSFVKKKGQREYEEWGNKEGVEDILRSEYPQLYELLLQFHPDIAQHIASAPARPGGTSTHINKLHSLQGRALLMGDAAHSMFISLGHGLNSALEDATVLGQVLDDIYDGSPSSLPSVCEAFTQRRLGEVSAAVQLSEDPPIPMFARTKLTGFKAMATHMVLTTAAKIVPGLKGPRSLKRLNESFVRAQKDVQEDELLAASIVLGAVSVLTAVALIGRQFLISR